MCSVTTLLSIREGAAFVPRSLGYFSVHFFHTFIGKISIDFTCLVASQIELKIGYMVFLSFS